MPCPDIESAGRRPGPNAESGRRRTPHSVGANPMLESAGATPNKSAEPDSESRLSVPGPGGRPVVGAFYIGPRRFMSGFGIRFGSQRTFDRAPL